MDKLSFWLGILQACAPILIALITIIPTIITNRKKTTDKIEELKQELKADIKATNDDVEEIKNVLDSHIEKDKDDNARLARIRILRFYDELCEGRWHSENHFEDIFEDIKLYKKRCEENKDFANGIAQIAISGIEDAYPKIKASGGFAKYQEKHDVVK